MGTSIGAHSEAPTAPGRTHRRRRATSLAATSLAAAGALVAALLVPAAPAQAGAGLSMTGFSPGAGPVGTTVTISGTGFLKADIVAFHGTTATVTKVNAAGTVLTTSVPALSTTGAITVTDPNTGQTVGLPGTAFQVTRGIFATPNHVWAGGRLTLEGSGLTADQTDAVQIAGATVTHVRINSSGSFKIGVTVPLLSLSGIARLAVVDRSGPIVTIIFVLGSWPMYRHDVQHTGVDTYETTLSVSSVSAMTQLWTKFTDSTGIWVVPSVANGLVFESLRESGTSPASSDLYAFTTDGKKMPWLTGGYYTVWNEPAVVNGNLYFTASQPISPVTASLNAANGTTNWSNGLSIINSYPPSPPTVAAGSLFVGEQDGKLYALNAATGAVKWSFQTGGYVYSSPAYNAGIVYVGSDSGTFYAVNATTGKKVWSIAGLGAIDSSPAVVGGIVYVGSDDGSVIAVNATTGAVVWHVDYFGEGFPASPTVAKGVVYIGGGDSTNGYLYALNASTGTELWHVTSGPGITDAAYANGVLYYSIDGSGPAGLAQVRAIDASNGNVLWHTYSVTQPTAPIIANGQLYVEGQNSLYVFGLAGK